MANQADEASNAGVEYVGFWLRFVASVIDSILVMALVYPLMAAIFGWDNIVAGNIGTGASLLLELVLPAVAVIVFWIYKSATPGKMAVGAQIVDAKSFGKASTGQLIGRYFAYYISTIFLLLGFFWVAFDARKQGWHDKLAGTVVIKKR